MKMKTKHSMVTVLACGLLALAAISSAEAAEMSLAGHSVWSPQTVSSVKLPDGRTIERQHVKGFAIANDPNSPFRNVSQDCMFTVVTSADGNSVSSGGFCDGIDADGNVYWVWAQADESGGNWHYIGGTGKFEGIQGGGTYELATEWPDGKVRTTWEGTWKIE